MADELFTRCPGCKTIFRVTEPQLALRQGQVRCGHCRTVFNGRDELIALDPPALDEDHDADELAAGPPVEVPDYENRFAWNERKPVSRAWKVLGAIAIPILVLALALQAIVHFRDALAAHVPSTKPGLTTLCTVLGCSVRPLRNADALAIESSDLKEDLAHKGLLILSATLRNRGSVPIAFPHVELTLTDAQDQIVVRRALAPADYLSGTANAAAGIPANGEVPVRLFIDASATQQAGYRLYLFFP